MFGGDLFDEFGPMIGAAIRRRYADIADFETSEELALIHCSIVKSVFLADNETGYFRAEELRQIYLREQLGFSCVRTIHFGVINELLKEIEIKYQASPIIISEKASLASIIGSEVWSILKTLGFSLQA